MRALALTGCVFLLNAGCGKVSEPPPTVSWYMEHPDAMQAKVTWCVDDIQRKQSGECENALAASTRAQLGSMKDAPPLDWNQHDPKKR